MCSGYKSTKVGNRMRIDMTIDELVGEAYDDIPTHGNNKSLTISFECQF